MRIDNLEETVYRGNGKPSLLARIEVCETRQDTFEAKQEKWEKIALKLLFSAVGLMVTVIGHLLWESLKGR